MREDGWEIGKPPTHRIFHQFFARTYATVGRISLCSHQFMLTRTVSRSQTSPSKGVEVLSVLFSRSNARAKTRMVQDIPFHRVALPCHILAPSNLLPHIIIKQMIVYIPLVRQNYSPSSDEISVIHIVFFKEMRCAWRVG